MKRQQPLQPLALGSELGGRTHDVESRPRQVRCYRIPQLLNELQMSRTTFERARRAGKLPFLEELQPRIGGPRYRADLIDRYFAGQFGKPRSFHRSA